MAEEKTYVFGQDANSMLPYAFANNGFGGNGWGGGILGFLACILFDGLYLGVCQYL